MDVIKFSYEGLTFEIHTLDVMVCIESGDTVGLITPDMTLEQVQALCDKYLNFLNNEMEGK